MVFEQLHKAKQLYLPNVNVYDNRSRKHWIIHRSRIAHLDKVTITDKGIVAYENGVPFNVAVATARSKIPQPTEATLLVDFSKEKSMVSVDEIRRVLTLSALKKRWLLHNVQVEILSQNSLAHGCKNRSRRSH
jgi:hypothetical protein